ncbi:MAG: aldehyde dehydrogenase family protein [Firmicutes bacterium]|nr:aldehyde dehydrogenase family protein [Bacillota bacterium]
MAEQPTYGFYIGGQWVTPTKTMPVSDKYRGTTLAYVGSATREEVQAAIEAADQAFQSQSPSPQERAQWLLRSAALLQERRQDFAHLMAQEGGKPLKEALGEVDRAVQTFILSAEEGKRIGGETLPIAAQPGSEHRLAFTMRVPIGVVVAISPFNFPLNLVAHKVAPALAAGNTVVLKPASYTPLTTIRLVEVLAEAGVPAGRINLITGPGGSTGDYLLEDPRPAFYTFTGSAVVGQHIKEASGLRRVALELGNNSPNIVHSDADLTQAAVLCARQGFLSAGQKCISVQRIYVHQPVYEAFLAELVAVTQRLVVGDPQDPATDVGPMIDPQEAERVAAWLDEAVSAGARIVCGGHHTGALFEPTIVADVQPEMKLVCREVFAPLVTVTPYADFKEAVKAANDTVYGLQAGVFTHDLDLAMHAAKELAYGGVIINDTSAYRADLMPYGGVKQSGIGREGPRYAIEEMTDLRTVVLNLH